MNSNFKDKDNDSEKIHITSNLMNDEIVPTDSHMNSNTISTGMDMRNTNNNDFDQDKMHQTNQTNQLTNASMNSPSNFDKLLVGKSQFTSLSSINTPTFFSNLSNNNTTQNTNNIPELPTVSLDDSGSLSKFHMTHQQRKSPPMISNFLPLNANTPGVMGLTSQGMNSVTNWKIPDQHQLSNYSTNTNNNSNISNNNENNNNNNNNNNINVNALSPDGSVHVFTNPTLPNMLVTSNIPINSSASMMNSVYANNPVMINMNTHAQSLNNNNKNYTFGSNGTSSGGYNAHTTKNGISNLPLIQPPMNIQNVQDQQSPLDASGISSTINLENESSLTNLSKNPNIKVSKKSSNLNTMSTKTIGKNKEKNLNKKNVSAAATAAAKKKRQKLIKSCLSCRKRKLKCDKVYPICGSCSSRGFNDCVYLTAPSWVSPGTKPKLDTSKFSSDQNITNIDNTTNDGEITGNGLNNKNMNNSNDKNDFIKATPFSSFSTSNYSSGTINTRNFLSSSESTEREHNKLLDFDCISLKNERFIYFGATSMRSSIKYSDSTFLVKFFKAWKEFKKARLENKKKTKHSVLKEITVIERDDGMSILNNVIKDLPKNIEVFEISIDLYFTSFLNNFYHVLSEEKTKKDLKRIFEIDEFTEEIKKIKPTGKKNYYTVGIILLILAFTNYNRTLPDSFLEFFVFLEGFSTGKPSCIERAQFLFLKTQYRLIVGTTGGDASHVVNVIGNLCNTVVNLGLNRDVYKIYKDDVAYLGGDLNILKNLFYWALYLDVYTSIHFGKPLFISMDVFDCESLLYAEDYKFDDIDSKGNIVNGRPAYLLLDKKWNRRLRLLKTYLYYARNVVTQLYHPRKTPNLYELIDYMEMFFTENMEPFEDYFSKSINYNFDVFDYILISGYSQIILAMFCVQKILLGDREEFQYVNNNIIKYSLLSLKICSIVTVRCIDIQQKHEVEYKNIYEKASRWVSIQSSKPNILLVFDIRASLMMRAILEYYKLLFGSNTIRNANKESLKFILEKFILPQSLNGNIHAYNLKENKNNFKPYPTSSLLSELDESNERYVDGEFIFFNKFDLKYFTKENMNKYSFSGLQLYKWFCNTADEMFAIENEHLKTIPKFIDHIWHMKAMEKVTRVAYDSFIAKLCQTVSLSTSHLDATHSAINSHTTSKTSITTHNDNTSIDNDDDNGDYYSSPLDEKIDKELVIRKNDLKYNAYLSKTPKYVKLYGLVQKQINSESPSITNTTTTIATSDNEREIKDGKTILNTTSSFRESPSIEKEYTNDNDPLVSKPYSSINSGTTTGRPISNNNNEIQQAQQEQQPADVGLGSLESFSTLLSTDLSTNIFEEIDKVFEDINNGEWDYFSNLIEDHNSSTTTSTSPSSNTGNTTNTVNNNDINTNFYQ